MFAVSAPASALAARPAASHARARPPAAPLAVRAAVTTVDAPAEGSVALTRRDAVLGAAAASLGLLVDTRAARALDVGAAAPVFTLPATGGGTVALADVVKANKYTVLYFYNQDFSSGCSIEAERFNQALGDFKAKGAEVVGVSMDPMDKHEEFCSAKDLKFKLLSDNDGKVSEAYGADLKIPHPRQVLRPPDLPHRLVGRRQGALARARRVHGQRQDPRAHLPDSGGDRQALSARDDRHSRAILRRKTVVKAKTFVRLLKSL